MKQTCMSVAGVSAALMSGGATGQVDFVIERFIPTEEPPLSVCADDFGFAGDGLLISIDRPAKDNVIFVPSVEHSAPGDFVVFGNFILPRFIRTHDIWQDDGIPDPLIADGGEFDLMVWLFDGVDQFSEGSFWSDDITVGGAFDHDEGQDGISPTYVVFGISGTQNEIRSQAGDGDNPPQGSGVDHLVNAGPVDVATGHFDPDAFEDALVVSAADRTVTLLLNDGLFNNGNNIGLLWIDEATTALGAAPIRILAGAFDEQIGLDGVVATDAPAIALIENGRALGPISPLEFLPADMTQADFDGDGDLDLAVCGTDGFGAGRVDVLLNDGEGVFASGTSCVVPGAPVSIDVVHLSGDARPDLAIASQPAGAFVLRNIAPGNGERGRIVADDRQAHDWFGAAVVLDAGRAVIGARFGDSPGVVDCGSAYTYIRVGSAWVLEDELFQSIPEPDAEFGAAAAMRGSTLLVGAPFSDTDGADSGAVEAFTLNAAGGWDPAGALAPSAAGAGNQFGASIDIDGNRAVIGARGFSSSRGAAYVFEWNGSAWNEVQMLRPLDTGDRNPNDLFGSDVTILGDRIVIGAHHDDEAATNAGAAYIFEWNGASWEQTQKLLPSDGHLHVNNRFGFAVGLGDGTLLIGAEGHDGPAEDAGAAYVFDEIAGVFAETAIMHPADIAEGDSFGRAIDIEGGQALITSMRDYIGGPLLHGGSCYVFDHLNGAWRESRKIVDLDSSPRDLLGNEVALGGGVGLIGISRLDVDGLENAGGALMVDLGLCRAGRATRVVNVDIITGAMLGGGPDELDESDDAFVRTRSGFGQTFVDVHHVELLVTAETQVASPTRFDLIIESRIDEPSGLAQARLFNWSSGQFELIGSYPIGMNEEVNTFDRLSAPDYISASGEIMLSIKELVFVPFFAFTFESFFDLVRFNVN